MGLKEKFAFTLAEVLITLGIIGVVAAITIPNMIASYNKKITETRLAKFYSVFNQAIRLSVADNGDVDTWDYWNASGNIYKDGQVQYNETGVEGAFETYLKPYMQIAYKKRIKFNNINQTLYVLPDGSAFTYGHYATRDITFFPKNAEKCITRITSKPPIGVCSFMFIFYPISESNACKYLYNKGIEPYLYAWDGNKEHLKSGSTYSCTNKGYYCTAMIKNNGWKIPKDYPLKIQY